MKRRDVVKAIAMLPAAAMLPAVAAHEAPPPIEINRIPMRIGDLVKIGDSKDLFMITSVVYACDEFECATVERQA